MFQLEPFIQLQLLPNTLPSLEYKDIFVTYTLNLTKKGKKPNILFFNYNIIVKDVKKYKDKNYFRIDSVSYVNVQEK